MIALLPSFAFAEGVGPGRTLDSGSTPEPSDWLLATGFWDDTGVWDDTATWID